MFNATDLLKQWNKSSKTKPKRVLETKKHKGFLEVLEQDEDILHRGNSTYVKSRASRGANAGTFMHPFLFIKFTMWLNPRFELVVIDKIHYLCC